MTMQEKRQRRFRPSGYEASQSDSIRQAKLALYLLKGVGARPAGPIVDRTLFRETQVLKIFQVFDNSLAGKRGFGPTRRLRQAVQAIVDVRRQLYRKHRAAPKVLIYEPANTLIPSGADLPLLVGEVSAGQAETAASTFISARRSI